MEITVKWWGLRIHSHGVFYGYEYGSPRDYDPVGSAWGLLQCSEFLLIRDKQGHIELEEANRRLNPEDSIHCTCVCLKLPRVTVNWPTFPCFTEPGLVKGRKTSDFYSNTVEFNTYAWMYRLPIWLRQPPHAIARQCPGFQSGESDSRFDKASLLEFAIFNQDYTKN